MLSSMNAVKTAGIRMSFRKRSSCKSSNALRLGPGYLDTYDEIHCDQLSRTELTINILHILGLSSTGDISDMQRILSHQTSFGQQDERDNCRLLVPEQTRRY